jgi:hypothetical protein
MMHYRNQLPLRAQMRRNAIRIIGNTWRWGWPVWCGGTAIRSGCGIDCTVRYKTPPWETEAGREA